MAILLAIPVCAGACLFGSCDTALAAKPASTYRILAGPYDKKAAPGSGARVTRFSLKGLTVEAEFLEPAERAAFIRRIDPGAADPFAVASGRLELFHAFRMEFDNKSSLPVTFQAGNVLLVTDRNEQQFAIDLTDLYRRAVNTEAVDPEAVNPETAIAQAARYIFDSSTTIPAGTTLSRLLVFGPLPETWKEFRLHVSFLQIGAQTHTLSFAFHRQFVKE
jgi:hypothetical protein